LFHLAVCSEPMLAVGVVHGIVGERHPNRRLCRKKHTVSFLKSAAAIRIEPCESEGIVERALVVLVDAQEGVL
jgi:hypothetical protein